MGFVENAVSEMASSQFRVVEDGSVDLLPVSLTLSSNCVVA
jgi:hypothetical protein